jgi:hypothetical protein
MASTSAWLVPQRTAKAAESLMRAWALIQSLVFEIVVPDFSQMNVPRASHLIQPLMQPFCTDPKVPKDSYRRNGSLSLLTSLSL